MVKLNPDIMYISEACNQCGSTIKYKSTRSCVPCRRESGRKSSRKWSLENPEYQTRYQKGYRESTGYQKGYRKIHQEEKNAHNQKRRALARGNGHEPYSRKEVFKLYPVCLCCGAIEDLQIDHVVPVSKGGADRVDNLQVLCGSCNLLKMVKSTDYRKDLTDV